MQTNNTNSTNSKTTNNICLEVETANVLNFLTAIEYLKDDLIAINCPDFECNAYELFKTDVVVEKLTKLVANN